jgi:undecaprenyl-diphosphatase
LLWVVHHRVWWLDPVFVGLSLVGYAGLIWIALSPLVARLGRKSVLFSFALTAVCVWSADLLTLILKAITDRPRPFETIPDADPLLRATVGQSMPSGHAATSFAGAVVLTFLLPRAAPLFFLLAAAIAFARVYVGVHYFSDVLVGALVGAAVALSYLFALRLLPPTAEARRRSEAVPPAG